MAASNNQPNPLVLLASLLYVRVAVMFTQIVASQYTSRLSLSMLRNGI